MTETTDPVKALVAGSARRRAAMLRVALDSSGPEGCAAWANLPMAGTGSSELGFKHRFGTVGGGSACLLAPWLDDNRETVTSYSNAAGTFRATAGTLDTAAAGYLYGTDLAEQTDDITGASMPPSRR
jgi:hypothetical protein